MEEGGRGKYLIDGFPRNHENLTIWNQSVGRGWASVDHVLILDIDDDVVKKRILKRGFCLFVIYIHFSLFCNYFVS